MTDDEWRHRDRLLLGLLSTELALVLAGAFCFAGHLVDAHLVPIAADADVIFVGIGSILAVSGFVLIGLHTFFASRALWAADYRQTPIPATPGVGSQAGRDRVATMTTELDMCWIEMKIRHF